jgi:hypothetical protein
MRRPRISPDLYLVDPCEYSATVLLDTVTRLVHEREREARRRRPHRPPTADRRG